MGVPALATLLAGVDGDSQGGGGAGAAAGSAPEGGAYEADLATLNPYSNQAELTPT